MKPAPVGVKGNGGRLGRATTSSATLRPGELRVTFSCVGADFLAESSDDEEGKRDKSCLWEHPKVSLTRRKPEL